MIGVLDNTEDRVFIPSFSSYPKIYALGHRETKELLLGPVNVEEKCDGSQFSMCVDSGG